jgi:hypothetical protein
MSKKKNKIAGKSPLKSGISETVKTRSRKIDGKIPAAEFKTTILVFFRKK